MSLDDDWTNKINRAGKSAATSLITNHQLFFTPTRYPDNPNNLSSGGVYLISYAASLICLGHDAYNLHRYRSIWMNSLGELGLIVGDFSLIGGGGVYRFIEPCEKIWTKPGALKLDTKYKINVEVMVDGDFAGSTRVCLNDEPCLTFACSPTGGLR